MKIIMCIFSFFFGLSLKRQLWQQKIQISRFHVKHVSNQQTNCEKMAETLKGIKVRHTYTQKSAYFVKM